MVNILESFDYNTKPALVPTLYLIPDWISRLLEDCEKEAENEEAWSIKLLETEGRAAIWTICSILGVGANGIPGLACRLVERYLAIQMRIYATLQSGSQEWEAFKWSLTFRLPLTMVSCIQLASKMNCGQYLISAKVVRANLICNGIFFSIAEINQSEFHVFSVLGFRIPLWTSVEMGEALAVDAGFSQDMLESVALFVNISEYRRDRLDNRVRFAANLSPSSAGFNRAKLRTLHLVAGCVAATARYLSFVGPDPTPRLAALTRAPLCYIRCICDIIITSPFDDHDEVKLPQKRKWQ